MEAHHESELARSSSVLLGVERALARLSDGSYGSCETCGAPILAADLDADPTRRVCEQHLAIGAADSI
jgi:RNA polymerase-binding transcription factor DksA